MEKTAEKTVKRGGWLRRNWYWVLSPFFLGAAWFLFIFYWGVQVYARNQGNPWNNFDTNFDGRFSRAEVDELYGMSGGKFTFCDEDGDGFLTPQEYAAYCGRGWVSEDEAPHTRKAARALQLLRQPSEISASLLAAYGNEDGNIYRAAAGLFWEVPEFSGVGLDRNADGIITEPELREALGLPPPVKKGFLSRFFAG